MDNLRQAVEYLLQIKAIESQKELADKMRSSEATLSRALNNGATSKYLIRFNSTFDNMFSMEWLKRGVGNMLANQQQQHQSGGNIIQGNNNSHISQINGSSVSSHQSVDDAQSVCLETGAVEGEAIEFLPVVPAKLAQSADEDTWQYIQQNPVPRQPVVMQFPEYHTTLQVRSDAMAPRLRSGDHVALRHMGRNPKVMNGEVYCFDTRDGGLVIREGTNIPGGYRLHARSERYADDVLMYEEVLNVYEVVGAVIMNI